MIDYMMTYFLIALLSSLCLIPFAVFLRKGKPDIFEPIYMATAYFFLIFVVRAVYIVNVGSEFISSGDMDFQTLIAMNTALLLLVPSYLMFLAGYYANINKSIVARLPSLPKEWDSRRFYVFVPVVLAISVWSYILLLRYFGGFSYYASHKQEALTSGGQQYYLVGISLTVQLLTISFTIYFGKKSNRFLNGLFAFFILLPAVLLYSALSGSKGTFMLPVLSLLIVYHYLRKPVKPLLLVMFLSMYILVAPFFDSYRSVRHASEMPEAAQRSLESYDTGFLMTHGMARFHDLEALTFIIRDTPAVMDYQYGKTFLPVFVAWIPRQLWPGKPVVVFGKIFSETYFSKWLAGTGTSASPTFVGEGYINFNLPGMLVVAFLSGLFLRSSYEYFIRRNFGAPGIFFMSFNYMFVTTFWEGSIAGFLAMMMTNVACFILFVLMMGKIKTVPSDEGCLAEAN